MERLFLQEKSASNFIVCLYCLLVLKFNQWNDPSFSCLGREDNSRTWFPCSRVVNLVEVTRGGFVKSLSSKKQREL